MPTRGQPAISFRIRPMLAELVRTPFHRDGWIHEEKYDGYRMLAYKEGDRVQLVSRSGKDWTEKFADVAAAVAKLPAKTALIDGEVVVFDDQLISRFDLLRKSAGPRIYAVFDCMYRDGEDLRTESLHTRRSVLEELVVDSERLFPARRLASNGLQAFREAMKTGHEGVVGKDPTAPYTPGPTDRWLKVRKGERGEFLVGGYAMTGGSLTGLLLGVREGQTLHYVGTVAFNATGKTRTRLWERLQRLTADRSPFSNLRRRPETAWAVPDVMIEVAFQEWQEGQLRHPVFRRVCGDEKEGR